MTTPLQIRFNRGFHDGQHDAAGGQHPSWREVGHFDSTYVVAYFSGVNAYNNSGTLAESGDAAFQQFTAGLLASEVKIQPFLFKTEGEGDEIEVTGSTISDDELQFLLNTDPAIVYAFNQDGLLLQVMFDMDEESLIALPVELTALGIVEFA